jgi:ADP-heptose:LPS heptosyltransferase
MGRSTADLPAATARLLGTDGDGATILVVRLGAMGDVVRTVPAVRLVARRWPRARIVWVVDAAWRVVLDGHPDLAGLIEIPRRAWGRAIRSPATWPGLVGSIASVSRALSGSSASLVLDFHGDLRSGALGWFSRAPVRVGFEGHQQREGNRWFTTQRVPSGDRRTPRLARNLSLVRAIGVPTDDVPPPDLPLVARGRDAAADVLGALGLGGRDYAIVSPGASARQAYKKPPAAALAAGCAAIARNGGAALVVWGPGEETDARRVVDLAGASAQLAPATTIPALAALTAGARLFLGGDSGPMHLACAVGCPVVAIYGPTDPVVNAPWGVPHRIVCPPGRSYTGVRRADRPAGFDGLEPADVPRAVEELWAGADRAQRVRSPKA